jgi:rubredoxin
MSIFRCPECDFVYDEDLGDDYEGYAPGTRFDALPEDFTCPSCAVTYKSDFLKAADDNST